VHSGRIARIVVADGFEAEGTDKIVDQALTRGGRPAQK
jgi:hypothetical protein